MWQASRVYSHEHVDQGTPRLLAYPTGRGVCFSSAHTRIEHCLKCGTRTDRVSKRTLGSLARGRYGQKVVVTTRVGLRLCEPYERWGLRRSLRVKSIDDDGMVELAGVHPAVVAEICGDEAP